MPLSDAAIRKAKPADKPQRLFDGGGLYLELSPAGSKLWRLKYRFGGKEKRLALGAYPAVSLAQARERRDEARAQLAQGQDPGEVRKAARHAAEFAGSQTFEIVGRDWLKRQRLAESTRVAVTWVLERKLFPHIGARPVGAIEPPELLAALRKSEAAGTLETAKRARSVAGRVFRYAIACGLAERDPSRDLAGALTPPKPQSFPAITDPAQLGTLLRALWAYPGSAVVACALRLQPLVFVRPGELRQAPWSEFDLEGALWTIPAERMKTRHDHLVPLSRQAVEILRELHAVTGGGALAFPANRGKDRPMSENTLAAALATLGYRDRQSAHGFRATARTLLDEALHFPAHLIEHQLAHEVRDAMGRSYNRTTHLSERRRMMQAWADYLENLRASRT
ncbi:integrase arm-type DNA-binding domain-containing protein [uncultured Aquimonas sp.]|mgnify:CR=1 FL=1|uniref:tyrosine-type recombinase/integrase n=1 Tax=uncultured Aquimonas sp. TaxID=385483 RepID=UPI00086C1E41|nr:integrase arm-type DNA-binding domain-containing protein [uncultured Aquimonas sp.]ODU41236.1 MAG: integrase [Xanthomonadaceae bacterium SCN 69-123]